MPLTLELLGDVRGSRILDVGCGEGGYSRKLTERGAIVVGVDGSARLVSIARERAVGSGQNIEYICANASLLERITTESFHWVLASKSLAPLCMSGF